MTALKPLPEQVVVITGASSGIGLAAARMAAAKGARVVLAARSVAVLDEVARGIEAGGGQALALARAAVARFGRIDTWINDAGVSIWVRIDRTPEADMRQSFEINFRGVVHGRLAALPHLRASKGGALINLGSLGSDYARPLQEVYSASKHAVNGFTDALRAELRHEGAGVTVTLVKPAGIGTPPGAARPQPRRARGEGSAADLQPARGRPRHPAGRAHPMRDAFVGGVGPVMSAGAALAPRLMDAIGATVLYGIQQGKGPPQPGDNLHGGLAEGQERDAEASARSSLYSRASNSSATPLPALGIAPGAAALMGRRREGEGRQGPGAGPCRAAAAAG